MSTYQSSSSRVGDPARSQREEHLAFAQSLSTARDLASVSDLLSLHEAQQRAFLASRRANESFLPLSAGIKDDVSCSLFSPFSSFCSDRDSQLRSLTGPRSHERSNARNWIFALFALIERLPSLTDFYDRNLIYSRQEH